MLLVTLLVTFETKSDYFLQLNINDDKAIYNYRIYHMEIVERYYAYLGR